MFKNHQPEQYWWPMTNSWRSNLSRVCHCPIWYRQNSAGVTRFIIMSCGRTLKFAQGPYHFCRVESITVHNQYFVASWNTCLKRWRNGKLKWFVWFTVRQFDKQLLILWSSSNHLHLNQEFFPPCRKTHLASYHVDTRFCRLWSIVTRKTQDLHLFPCLSHAWEFEMAMRGVHVVHTTLSNSGKFWWFEIWPTTVSRMFKFSTTRKFQGLIRK